MRMKPVWAMFWALLAAVLAFPTTAHAAGRDGRMVEVAPGVSLRVVDTGVTGTKPPLVLVPGWGAGADIWARQIETFAKERRVISFDPRSQGGSTIAIDGNTPDVRAQDLHALLAKLGVERPVLVGWSQGVQDLAAYAGRYGSDGVAGFVFVDAAVSDGARGIAARPEAAAQQFNFFSIYTANQRAYLEGMFGFIISKPPSKEAVAALVDTAMKTPPTIGVAMLVADMFGRDLTPGLAKITVPTLVVAAASSPELERQRAAAGQTKGARFESVADAAHAVFIDQPERFEALLADFIAPLR